MHANFMAVCFIEPELLPQSKLYIAGIGIFYLFAPVSCDLDLDPMTFIYELEMSENERHKAFASYRLTDIHRQTH